MGRVRGRNLLEQLGADVIVLVKTKLEAPIDKILQSIWSNRWVGVLKKEA